MVWRSTFTLPRPLEYRDLRSVIEPLRAAIDSFIKRCSSDKEEHRMRVVPPKGGGCGVLRQDLPDLARDAVGGPMLQPLCGVLEYPALNGQNHKAGKTTAYMVTSAARIEIWRSEQDPVNDLEVEVVVHPVRDWPEEVKTSITAWIGSIPFGRSVWTPGLTKATAGKDFQPTRVALGPQDHCGDTYYSTLVAWDEKYYDWGYAEGVWSYDGPTNFKFGTFKIEPYEAYLKWGREKENQMVQQELDKPTGMSVKDMLWDLDEIRVYGVNPQPEGVFAEEMTCFGIKNIKAQMGDFARWVGWKRRHPTQTADTDRWWETADQVKIIERLNQMFGLSITPEAATRLPWGVAFPVGGAGEHLDISTEDEYCSCYVWGEYCVFRHLAEYTPGPVYMAWHATSYQYFIAVTGV